MTDPAWRVYTVAEEIAKLASSPGPYHEFLRVPSLSCGIYSLAVGAKDLQGPHDEDEVYFVLSGRGRLRVDGEVLATCPAPPPRFSSRSWPCSTHP